MATKTKKSSGLSKAWTTVTPVSRVVALILFVIVAVGAFYLGIYYQKETRAGYPNFFCHKWDTICDPDYAEPNGYCAVKRVCIDPAPPAVPGDMQKQGYDTTTP